MGTRSAGRPKGSTTSSKTNRTTSNPSSGTTRTNVDQESDTVTQPVDEPVINVMDTDEETEEDEEMPMQEEAKSENEADFGHRVLWQVLEEREQSIRALERKLDEERQQRIAAEVQLGELRTQMNSDDDTEDDDTVVPYVSVAGFDVSALNYTPQAVPIDAYVEKSVEIGERDRLKHNGLYVWERVNKGNPLKDPNFARQQWVCDVAKVNGDHPINWSRIVAACHIKDMVQRENFINRYRYNGLATLDTCNDKTFLNHLEILSKNIDLGNTSVE